MRPGGRSLGLALLTITLSSLPFLRGVAAGGTFYFRDLFLDFIPTRVFVADGLAHGEVRYWNPYVHEGELMRPPPLGYPLDLLAAAKPGPRSLTLLLAAHVPLAGLAMLILARGLGLGGLPSLAAAVVYALGGFALSTLNFYVYVEALAWAPLLVLALVRASQSLPHLAWAALAVGISLSTSGVELVGQALLFGFVLADRPLGGPGLAKRTLAVLLGLGLAAPAVAILPATLEGSVRGRGFSTDVVLAHSIHPLTWLQTVIAGLHGDPADLVGHWWGQNFFPRGFPYFLSFYLGATVLCLALIGVQAGGARERRLAGLSLLGVVVGLGRWIGWRSLIDPIPLLHHLRYPAKAFFGVHLAVALLAAFGLEHWLRRPERGRPLALLALALGGLLAAGPLLPSLAPGPARVFAAGFFPPDLPEGSRLPLLRFILMDGAVGGLVCLALGILALLVATGRLRPALAGAAVIGLLAGDLLRAGAGLNPMVPVSFFQLSPQMSARADEWRRTGGRLFTCDVGQSAAYRQARQARGDAHELWTFATLRETLTPPLNLLVGVPSAYSEDISMMVPTQRVLGPAQASCADFSAIAERLRRAGVSQVLSLDPLESPQLEPQGIESPPGLAPLSIHIYGLREAIPLRGIAGFVHRVSGPEAAEALASQPGFLPDHVAVEGPGPEVAGASGRIVARSESADGLELAVEADRATLLVVRDAFARGWSASVDGQATPVLRADGRHRAVAVPAGPSRVRLRYTPPGLGWGWLMGSLSALATGGLFWHRRLGIP